MKFISAFLMSSVLMAAMFASGAQKKSQSVRPLVEQYYQQKEMRSNQARHPECPPSSPSQTCFDAACDKLGTFGCDDMSEINSVNKACRGNYDGHCLNVVCGKLGPFGCDDMSEIQKVARACVGNYDTGCFSSVCERLGPYGCDDMSEVQQVLNSCAGN